MACSGIQTDPWNPVPSRSPTNVSLPLPFKAPALDPDPELNTTTALVVADMKMLALRASWKFLAQEIPRQTKIAELVHLHSFIIIIIIILTPPWNCGMWNWGTWTRCLPATCSGVS
jgi:hypothetical protein